MKQNKRNEEKCLSVSYDIFSIDFMVTKNSKKSLSHKRTDLSIYSYAYRTSPFVNQYRKYNSYPQPWFSITKQNKPPPPRISGSWL